MISNIKIAVASRSFSKNAILRNELLSIFPNAVFNETGKSLSGQELIDFLSDHERAIIALEQINDFILSALPKLKVISKYGVGLDNLDYLSLMKHNVSLGWAKGVNKRSVAELALSFALLALRRSVQSNTSIKGSAWNQIVGRQLTNKIVGIIGYGNVGTEFAKLLQPFECQILVSDILPQHKLNQEYHFNYVSLDELLCSSDVISVHVPFHKSTNNLIDKEKLSLMKENAVLINTARGGIVDESSLKIQLKKNQNQGAAFDVFGREPPDDMEFMNLPNFFATPHIGGSSQEAILSMGRAAIQGLSNYQHVSYFENEFGLK